MLKQAISGLSSRDVGNPYIVYGISAYLQDDKPDIALKHSDPVCLPAFEIQVLPNLVATFCTPKGIQIRLEKIDYYPIYHYYAVIFVDKMHHLEQNT